ncbi:uncharacterized protein SAPINGB_P004089 [Magnusiomyces paraingens]|uniref:Amino acid permease/ SLC12A domain-containing protein n=1 Tax=Magnusiomyces paraingens TaxID=2606893 RepID=A0A5E8C045_9ASCO|nr:uncharacterized protein SAPINGB_P004089 [Saprochaete ingens]VVT54465.1 unnamed protein product [Saprochaete ingens]
MPSYSTFDDDDLVPLVRSTSGAGITSETQLADLGYAQELPRRLSMMSILGLSFAIMGVPTGLSSTMAIGLTDGQHAGIFWGWVGVSLVSVCIAASLAEICSVFPTSGGVYYWSAMLAPHKWAPLASWTAGWLTLVGNWTVTTSICFSGAQLLLSSGSLFFPDWEPSALATVLAFWGVLGACALANALLANHHLAALNTVCIYWTATTVVVVGACLLAWAPEVNAPKVIFTHFDSSLSGWPAPIGLLVGSLQAAYTLTGYGMVASMCEEVQSPEREVPKGMILSVVAAGLTGVIFLIPVLAVLPTDRIAQLLAANDMPVTPMFLMVTGSPVRAQMLLGLLQGTIVFAGVGSLTAASRGTYAFARDGAIPGSHRWARVYDGVPVGGLFLSTAVCASLGLVYFGSRAAFDAFMGSATICLSASYGLPVAISLFRSRHALAHAPLKLGRFWGPLANWVTICWICLAMVLFSMPVSVPVTAGTMNYASAVFGGFFAIAAGWYVAWGRTHFHGPPELVEHYVKSGMGKPEVVEGLEVSVTSGILSTSPSPSSSSSLLRK